jgi:hypothetical protein
MEPIRVVKEGLIAMSGEDKVLVLDGLNDCLFGLLFEQLLLTSDVDNEEGDEREEWEGGKLKRVDH